MIFGGSLPALLPFFPSLSIETSMATRSKVKLNSSAEGKSKTSVSSRGGQWGLVVGYGFWMIQNRVIIITSTIVMYINI